MKSILIWGTGRVYREYKEGLEALIHANRIEVVGITSRDENISEVDGYRFLMKSEIKNLNIDFIVVAAISFEAIFHEALELGIPKNKIINVVLLYNSGWSFAECEQVQAILNRKGNWKEKEAVKNNSMSLAEYAEICHKTKMEKVSIVSINCSGGLLYHSLGLQFLSPFINMFETEVDYIRLLGNLKEYMAEPLIFLKTEYESTLKITYPVCLLGDIKLYMNHYPHFDLAVQKWEERKKRINFDNLFIMMCTEDPRILEKFDKLPYEKKACFVSFPSEFKSAFCVDKSFTEAQDMWNIALEISRGNKQNFYWQKLLRLLISK